VDPKFLSEGLIDLMETETETPKSNKGDDDFPSRRRRSS
jgi:hypothetical protein